MKWQAIFLGLHIDLFFNDDLNGVFFLGQIPISDRRDSGDPQVLYDGLWHAPE